MIIYITSKTKMSKLAESDMYDWRVRALMSWVDRNKNNDGSLSMERLCSAGHLDQYHYLGLEANDEVIRILGLDDSMKVLDVGCGIGGPARYIAWKSGAHLTGVDIQGQLVDAGNQVSKLVGLDRKVTLISGDATQEGIVGDSEYDAFISLLVILHIADRKALFRSLSKSLKPGGAFLIEDMVHVGSVAFSDEEDRIAKDVIGSPYLPSIDEYRTHLEDAGFVDIEFETLTPVWVKWCIARSKQYDESKDEQIRLNGEKVYNQRSKFYADVKNLFLGGKLGGVRITGRKPTVIERNLLSHRRSSSLRASSDSVRIIE
jgi:cyclopropane fatty-acyl-phospholipid synthase-like methyltransferase